MKKNFLFIATAIIIPVIFIGLRKNSAPFFSAKEYQCACPEFISHDYFSSITSLLAELFNEKCAAQELINRLKKEFSLLNKVIVSYRPSATHVTISAHEPVCCINNLLVLTHHNELVSKDCFSATALADIPKVVCYSPFDFSSTARPEPVEGYLRALEENPSTSSGRALGNEVSDMKNISPLVSQLLHQLPSDFNHLYNLEFMNEHYVRLVDKQEPHFAIALTVAQKKSSQLLAQCESVKKSIAARAGFDKGVKWIADARFAHYIVAYKT